MLERIELVSSVLFDLPVPMAEKDAPLLCAAIRARCHYFVTGDQRDFGPLFGQAFDGVVIIRPRQLAEKLAELRGSEQK